ncbi:MAG: type 1 glutamine amidotransferase, partial [Gammaproteobacteria bacterium]
FEDSELTVPVDKLKENGHEVTLIGLKKGETLEGKKGKATVTTDAAFADVDPDDFDALLIPGGYSPDQLRNHEAPVKFVQAFAGTGKPIAAICHGPQLLIEAGLVRDRRMTSWGSVRTDLQNAGARWEDASVVVDGDFITSRHPGDLEDFTNALLARLDTREEKQAANA